MGGCRALGSTGAPLAARGAGQGAVLTADLDHQRFGVPGGVPRSQPARG